jgi:hypothetical protein
LDITGTYELKAAPEKVWALLNDVTVLQSCIPGCKSLTATGKDSYTAELSVGIGPVRGVYMGTVNLKDRKPPHSYRMVVEGSGGAGFVKGDGVIALSPATGGGTTVQISGTVEAGGLLARVGQRLIGTASNNLMKQFFACLAKQAK